jgi:hypothetical protein
MEIIKKIQYILYFISIACFFHLISLFHRPIQQQLTHQKRKWWALRGVAAIVAENNQLHAIKKRKTNKR